MKEGLEDPKVHIFITTLFRFEGSSMSMSQHQHLPPGRPTKASSSPSTNMGDICFMCWKMNQDLLNYQFIIN